MSTPAQPFVLTDEERKLVTDNHNLIYSFLNKYHLTEDYYGACAIGLCRAAHSYRSENGKFSVYAYVCMSNVIRMEWRKQQRQVQPTISLNSTVCNEEAAPIELETVIPDPQDDYATSDLIMQIQCICKEDPIMQKVIPLHIKGYTAIAISDALDVPVHTVRRRIITFKEKLRNSLKNL